ncbi:c-type cytochrome biogenesis protein CcmI, partial [Aureimonas sp. AU12]|uniref:c-type cytochrome biogenesis protein CcmI n=1 Tax=Aureimonas sp. AU12 TaxID=1638161 RepID=UPI0007846FFD
MLFWLIAASLTLAVTLLTVLPLFRRDVVAAAGRAGHDAEVYRAQLSELAADTERGAIRPEDAAVARAEIGRRLLKASAEIGTDEALTRRAGRTSVIAGLLVALVLPVGTFLFYDRAGSPELGDQPLATRAPDDGPSPDLATMVAEIERRLAANPEDGMGWSVIAPVYLQTGDAAKAVTAFRNALRLTEPTAQKLAGLGEALVQAAGGQVDDEADAAFRQALALDPFWPPARFYLALRLSQQGEFAGARDAWNALIAASPADAPWMAISQAALADATAKLGGEAPAVAGGPRGPSAADVAAAEGLSEDDRDQMIEGMVSQLAARLQSAPNDLEGWTRLIRSYT